MRTSILSRSVIAVATLGIGSVTLAAVPATAATPSGITRLQVLTAAAGVRAAPSGTGSSFGNYGAEANRALRAMVNRTCAVDPDGPEVSIGSLSAATVAGGSAEGVVVSAILYNLDSSTGGSGPTAGRVCSFGALATTADRSVLSGTAVLTGAPTSALSGDAFITPAVNGSLETIMGPSSADSLPTFTATGKAVQTTIIKVADKKTKSQKKAAKNKYGKRLKAAKKSYTKALNKAGSSKSRKKAAKKAYSAKKKVAKAAYKTGIANFKLVPKKTATPFAVSAKVVPAP